MSLLKTDSDDAMRLASKKSSKLGKLLLASTVVGAIGGGLYYFNKPEEVDAKFDPTADSFIDKDGFKWEKVMDDELMQTLAWEEQLEETPNADEASLIKTSP